MIARTPYSSVVKMNMNASNEDKNCEKTNWYINVTGKIYEPRPVWTKNPHVGITPQLYQVGFQLANPTCHWNFASALRPKLPAPTRLSVVEAAQPPFPMRPYLEASVLVRQHQPRRHSGN